MTMRIINLLKLSCILGLLPMLVHAEEIKKDETGQELILYTPYTEVAVPPGEAIDYSIDIINRFKDVKNVTLSVTGMPRGWTSELKAGGFTVKQLSVLPDEKKSFNLKIQVPLQVNKGVYHFQVNAAELGTLPLAVAVSEHGTFKTEFTTSQPNMEGNSKASFTFNASLKNSTAEQQLYALTASAPRGWETTFKISGKQITSIQVEANQTENITIEINPPANVEAGSYRIPVTASTGNTSGKIELEVVITGSYEMTLTTPSGRISSDITAGSTKRIDMEVKNTGSAELKDIRLSSSSPADWEVSFEPSTINILRNGESTQVTAIVKASKKALPGDYMLKMEARVPEVTSDVSFRMTVETSLLHGWMGIAIIVCVLGGIFFLFRKYGRR